MSADPSAAARRAAQAYLREILQRAPFPPDIDRVARAIDAAYKRIYPTRNGAEGAGERTAPASTP